MVLFACSFDAVVPLGGWTTVTGSVPIVTGRNANGAQVGTGSSLSKVGALGASIVASLGYTTAGFSNSFSALYDTSGTGAGFAYLLHNADGRLYIVTGSTGGSTFTLVEGFVVSLNKYRFYELEASISLVLTPVDGTHSDVETIVNANLYVNNVLVGTGSDSHTVLNVLNSAIANGVFDTYTINPPGGGVASVVDDVFITTTRIGDAKVESDDSTITVETAAPDIDQSVIEVGFFDPDVAPVNNQSVIEVGVQVITEDFENLGFSDSGSANKISGPGPNPPPIPGPAPTMCVPSGVFGSGEVPPPDPPGTLTLACPIDGGTGTIGIVYDKFMVTTGGTVPFGFSIIAGSLPNGLLLFYTTGRIIGTPTVPGNFTFTVQVVDVTAASAIHTCNIIISA